METAPLCTVATIPREEVDSELGVVNAARVSTARASYWEWRHPPDSPCLWYRQHGEDGCGDATHLRPALYDADSRLIRYLLRHHHWTPFAHAQELFAVEWRDAGEALYLYRAMPKAGMAWSTTTRALEDSILGSLWWWVQALPSLPERLRQRVVRRLAVRYPTTIEALNLPRQLMDVGPEVHGWAPPAAGRAHLTPLTLRITCPIALARQARTSQVGIAYADLYVESEAIVYNELSRRYVDETPTFGWPETWRVREPGSGIKQGSSGEADPDTQERLHADAVTAGEEARMRYTMYVGERHVAPEQARFFLPQSMLTTYWATATIHRWRQWCALRLQPEVQPETRALAEAVQREVEAACSGF